LLSIKIYLVVALKCCWLHGHVSPVSTGAHGTIQVERLVSGDMSQRHETPIHPSTFYVKMSQEEVLLTCAAYIYYAFIRKEIGAQKEGVDETDKERSFDVSSCCRLSTDNRAHVSAHDIYCGTRRDLSRHIKQLCPDTVCRNICSLVCTGL
jgi:hypothetical protein